MKERGTGWISDGRAFAQSNHITNEIQMKKPNIFAPIIALIFSIAAAFVSEAQTVLSGDEVARLLSDRDIGATKLVGSRSFAQGSFVLKGAGHDIWGRADSFHFSHLWWDGDGQMVARVLSLQQTDPWAKVGLMIREGLRADSRYVMVALTPTNGVSFQHRTETGGPSSEALRNERISLNESNEGLATGRPTVPYWIKLDRRGNRFTAYCSTDGNLWEWIGTARLDLPQQLYLGLAISSHNPDKSCEAILDNVTVSQPLPTVEEALLGNGDGLRASYFPSSHLRGTPIVRIDSSINFEWNTNPPAMSIDREKFSVRWEGEVQAQFTEIHGIHVTSDDRARLWINGRLLIDDPSGHEALESSGTLRMQAGQKYFVRIEFFQNGGPAVAKLLWSSPSMPKQVIPQSQLYAQPEDQDGDGIPDTWERAFGLSFIDASNGTVDADGDGTTNLEEYRNGTNPLRADRRTAGLPAGWASQTIGNPLTKGNAAYSQGIYLVDGAGGDIWANADAFQFVYKQVSEDVQVIARIVNLEHGDPWAKAGVMVRQGLDGESKHAFIGLTPENGVTFQHRRDTAGATEADSAGPGTAPVWLKLLRRAGIYSAYRSSDGITWEWVASERIEMTNPVYVGLAVSSHRLGETCAARIDSISVEASPPPAMPLVGSGDGLRATYFDLATSNIFERTDSQVDFDWGTGSPLEGIAEDNFSARWEGAVEPQFSEVYAFHLINDDGARLWINGQRIIDSWSDRAATREGAKVILKSGHKYLLKMEFYERTGQALAKLQWSSPSTPRQAIPQSQLYSPHNAAYNAIEDGDGDGMPNRWEVLYGLDPADQSDGSGDADGDQLSNLQEYRSGTNPQNADTDGDGIPDGWEVSHGLNPLDRMDSSQDPDNDGLTNFQEYAAGTNPQSADTDGDGLSDAVETQETRTNPLVTDIQSIITVSELSGASAVNRLGRWTVDGNAIYANDRRGYVEYQLNAPQPGMFRVEIQGTSQRASDRNREFHLLISLDNEYLGRSVLLAGDATEGLAHQITPWLKAGDHRVRIYWDNAAAFRSLRLTAVRLQALEGSDANGNGVQDWAESRLQSLCGVEVAPASSFVSPACVEGRGGFLSMMNVSGGLMARDGAGARWYVNVPLSASNPRTLICSFQNGGMRTTNQIAWRPTNVLQGQDMVVRQGDALLFVAMPPGATNGVMNIVVGGSNYISAVGQPVAHRFPASGAFQVTGTYSPPVGGPQSRSITVKVVASSFGSAPAAWAEKQRLWTCGNLQPNVIVEADPRLKLEEIGEALAGPRRFVLGIGTQDRRQVVARLGTNGPVVDSATVQGFRLYSAFETGVRVIEDYEDGSQLVEMCVVLSPVLPQVTVRLEIQVGGVLFDDGTTIKELTATDFNELGEHRVRFIRPASAKTSVCHTTTVYQSGVFLGIHP